MIVTVKDFSEHPLIFNLNPTDKVSDIYDKINVHKNITNFSLGYYMPHFMQNNKIYYIYYDTEVAISEYNLPDNITLHFNINLLQAGPNKVNVLCMYYKLLREQYDFKQTMEIMDNKPTNYFYVIAYMRYLHKCEEHNVKITKDKDILHTISLQDLFQDPIATNILNMESLNLRLNKMMLNLTIKPLAKPTFNLTIDDSEPIKNLYDVINQHYNIYTEYRLQFTLIYNRMYVYYDETVPINTYNILNDSVINLQMNMDAGPSSRQVKKWYYHCGRKRYSYNEMLERMNKPDNYFYAIAIILYHCGRKRYFYNEMLEHMNKPDSYFYAIAIRLYHGRYSKDYIMNYRENEALLLHNSEILQDIICADIAANFLTTTL